MNIAVSIIICLALVGFFVLISINKKDNNMVNNSDNNANNTANIAEVAKLGDNVSMNYTGRLENGTVFDSNVDPKFNHVEPFSFTLGSGQVISGWDKGITGMKVGEKKTLTLAPEDAYGAAGRPPVIPPNSTLIFDVELVAINPVRSPSVN